MSGGNDTVLFICEHGSAKSVVAAAHFNRLAAERGLELRAVSRGTDPDAANHPAAVGGLEGDGLESQAEPRRLSATDLETAARVVAFSTLPAEYRAPAPMEVWTVPAVSEDYGAARDAIVSNIEGLLDDLASQR
jgi:protein-tyrosine-phosphatase